MSNKKQTQFLNTRRLKGFTLVEVLVGVAIFALITIAVYDLYAKLFSFIGQNQYKVLALNLGNEQFEIARNLSYTDLGVVGSIPNGKIPHVQTLTRAGTTFIVTTTIRNVDLPFDGIVGGTPNDLSPADNKLVEVEITCAACTNFSPLSLSSTIAPKNLETASTNGALFIKVFDANGVAVSGAAVHIVNAQVSPSIVIDDVTNNDGMLQIVDAPPGTEAYQITVTKSGFSTDKTYTSGASGNPTPFKPHATVLLQQLTQISFAIDRLSSLSFSSVTTLCVPVTSMSFFSLTGSKLIGPGVPKYTTGFQTNGSGNYVDNALEWDYYSVFLGSSSSYDIIGLNPLNPIAANPGGTGAVSIIVAPKNPRSLLVTVRDNATGLPVTDAEVTVTSEGGYDETKITGKGFINQTDWVGGGGQELFTDQTRYASNDGGVETSAYPGEVKLKNLFGSFVSSGILESSTIDTGSASNFYNLNWLPADQPAQAGTNSVRFQFASDASSTPETGWVFKGPDGTSGTYYSVSGASLFPAQTEDRYARYKIFLTTENSAWTPTISDVAFTFTSSCIPPGQVMFSGLASDDYHISVSKTGYSDSTADVSVSASWQEQNIILSP